MLVYNFGSMKRCIPAQATLGLAILIATIISPAAAQQRSAAEVESGKQLFTLHCQPCHGPEGDLVPGVDMRKGQFKRVSTDEEISRVILNGLPGTAMPPTNLPENSRAAVVAYIRSMHDAGTLTAGAGDAARGQAIFDGAGGCLNCHRVSGKGSRKGPDLSDIGALRNAATLERSMLDPNDTVLPQHRMLRAVTKSGTVITGMRLNEDTHTIQLIDENERLVSLSKSDLREYTVAKTSPMPSYQGKLTPQQVSDVVTYLLSLKGLP
jgi:cytochrome c oxidase cbb3-type subunit III